MNTHESNINESTKDTTAVLHKNEVKTNQYKRIPIAIARVDDIIRRIDICEGVLLTGTSSATETKTISREDLIDLAVVILGDLLDLGHENKDAELIRIGSMSETALHNLSATDFPVTIDNIVKTIDGLGSKLDDTDLTPAAITEFKTAIAGFNKNAGASGTTRTDVSTARETMTELFSRLSIELLRLDKLMKKFRGKDPEFYLSYTSARKIVDRGVRHNPVEPAPEPPK